MQMGSGDKIIGINYEGGKIITHILGFPNCIAYANCQIAMDAPYHGRVADESVRKVARSETQFPGYSEEYLISQLEEIFGFINEHYFNKKIVIQIARGRAGPPMVQEVILPILTKLSIAKYEFVYGYRSDKYYTPGPHPEPSSGLDNEFVFVNIGMFAVLDKVESTRVGEICNPSETVVVSSISDDKTKLISDLRITRFDDGKNILNKIPKFKKFLLFGIGDHMAFITPADYPRETVYDLVSHLGSHLD
jgi:hypothetical protein